MPWCYFQLSFVGACALELGARIPELDHSLEAFVEMSAVTPCNTQLFHSFPEHQASLAQRRKSGCLSGSHDSDAKRFRNSLPSGAAVSDLDSSDVADDLESVFLHASSRISSASSSCATDCGTFLSEAPQCPVLILKSIWKIQEGCVLSEASALVLDRTALQRKLSELQEHLRDFAACGICGVRCPSSGTCKIVGGSFQGNVVFW